MFTNNQPYSLTFFEQYSSLLSFKLILIIMGGLVVVEYIFAWPGLGQLSIKAILEQDFPVIQAYVLIVAILFVMFNTLADIINAFLNPRLREGKA